MLPAAPRAALVALALLAAGLAGCAGPPAPAPPGPLAPPGPDLAAIAAEARAFDGAAALALVREQVLEPRAAHGVEAPAPRYRVPGSEGSLATARLLAAWMVDAGLRVAWDNFTATVRGAEVPARNVLGERPGSTPATLYLVAHYDSRPWADKDPDPAKRAQPVLGANDGASGVAVLVALARLLEGRAMNLTLRLVLVDAEDMGDAQTPWIQGSTHHAAGLSGAEVRAARGLVLLDMVGDRDLQLRREAQSARPPHRALQDDLWAWAARLGHPQFRDAPGPAITDDHVPYQQRGIPAVDVIHLDDGPDPFPASHHTTFDDLDHVAAASLEAVGETVLAALLAWDAEAGAGVAVK